MVTKFHVATKVLWNSGGRPSRCCHAFYFVCCLIYRLMIIVFLQLDARRQHQNSVCLSPQYRSVPFLFSPSTTPVSSLRWRSFVTDQLVCNASCPSPSHTEHNSEQTALSVPCCRFPLTLSNEIVMSSFINWTFVLHTHTSWFIRNFVFLIRPNYIAIKSTERLFKLQLHSLSLRNLRYLHTMSL